MSQAAKEPQQDGIQKNFKKKNLSPTLKKFKVKIEKKNKRRRKKNFKKKEEEKNSKKNQKKNSKKKEEEEEVFIFQSSE